MPKSPFVSTTHAQGGTLHCYHLPRGMLLLRVYEQLVDESKRYQLEARSHIIPDPSHRYYLRHRKPLLSHDELKLRFSPQGFLQYLSRNIPERGTKSDELFGLAAAPAAAPGAGMPALATHTRSLAAVATPVYEVTFDPFDAAALQRVNKELSAIDPALNLHIPEGPTVAVPQLPTESDPQLGQLYPGILCRMQQALEVQLATPAGTQVQLVQLPHPHGIHLIEMPKLSGPSDHFSIEFDEWGYPTHIEIEQLNTVEQLLRLPIRLLKALMEIPAKIFQVRIDARTDKIALIESEMKLAEALQQKEQAEMALTAVSGLAVQSPKIAEVKAKEEIDAMHKRLLQVMEEKKRLEAISIPVGKDMDAFDLKLQVLRYSSGKDETLGLLFDITHGRKFLAYTLEDQFQEEKVKAETRIPAGTYAIQLRTEGGFHQRYLKKFKSPFHKGMLHIQDVPGFEFILIHSGNDDDDTEGCLLVGNQAKGNVGRAKGKIMDSVNAYKRIYPPIAEALLAGKTVGIEYIDYDTIVGSDLERLKKDTPEDET
ncbi:MAG: hypothetical protein D6730_25525 [Bacteroidetes bacterium]|nr:MAG: hypothetical protein D6730_25525 [Bacteroidota bacterium]